MGGGKITVEVLGTGCKSCERLYENAVEAVRLAGLEGRAEVRKVGDIDYFTRMGVPATPGLVVDGEVVCAGRVPGTEEIAESLRQAGGGR